VQGGNNKKDTRKTVYGAALVVAIGCLALALVVLAGSFVSFQLDKDHASFWDTAVKAVGGLVALIGAAIAFSKYIDEREKANQAALIEAQKPFTSKRQEVYFQLVTATSMIGNKEDRNHPLRREADSQFWQLYWGAVPMVEDEEVAKAIDAFSVALDDKPDDGVGLRNASMNLARACRKSLGFISH
jgi:hypothetical protein